MLIKGVLKLIPWRQTIIYNATSKDFITMTQNLQIIGFVVSRVNVVFHVWADKLGKLASEFLGKSKKNFVNYEILFKDIGSKRY